MTTGCYEATIDAVTEERLHEIMRDWLREQIRKAGSQRKLDEKSGIKHPQMSAALHGGQVSWLMIARISAMPGMSMSRVFDQLAERCADAEKVPVLQATAPETLEHAPRSARVDAVAKRQAQAEAREIHEESQPPANTRRRRS